MKKKIIMIFVLLFFVLACSFADTINKSEVVEITEDGSETSDIFSSDNFTETPSSLSTSNPTVAPTSTPLVACQIKGTGDSPIYYRPSIHAEVFSTFRSGMESLIKAKTTDGWLGFDPGVAQAANVGVFRYRWIQETGEIEQEGACENVPTVEGPLPGVVYLMPMQEVEVYALPDVTAKNLATLYPGDYVALIGRSTMSWSQVDLSIGTLQRDIQGWIQDKYLNVNGDYQSLPIRTFDFDINNEDLLLEVIMAYWENVSSGNYAEAWNRLTFGFKDEWHGNDFQDYVDGYEEMKICSIHTEDSEVLEMNSLSAVVVAKVVYRNGEDCQRREFYFDHHMIYNSDQGRWLIDRVVYHEE